jgi:NuA3 HAT complex component NTO1
MNPKEKLNLSKPVYRQVDPFKAFEEDHSVAVNYVDRTMANLGYQESDIFTRLHDKTLIRMAEGSIEEDLDLKTDAEATSTALAVGRVEYDMDEQDDRWLEALNAQRKEEGVEAIKPAIFEVTITQIEKEWHALEKRIPKPNPKPPQTHRPRSSSAAAVNGEAIVQGEEQDSKCAICDDGDCENTNAIVFCDGCDLAVHQECYGVPFIPEGQWLCRRCQLVGRGTPVSEQPGCIFCPNIDGAFKQTTMMKWSHLLCAMWIPEVSLGNTTFQEPVQDVEKVPRTRWKLSCYICKQKMGACIQCGHKSCFEAFHVTCARRARLCLRMKSPHSGNALDNSSLKAFCDKHSPPDWRRENDVERATADAKAFYRHTMRHARWGDSQAYALSLGNTQVPSVEGADEIVLDLDASGSNKRKRGQARSWRMPSGAPVVPQAVYHNVEFALIKFGIRKRKEFVQEACKYWTLKREARRGAALLKRLQLQMEAFTSMEITRRNFAGMGAAGRPRLQRRIEFAERLEDDMEQIRVLCEMIKQREAKKREDVELLRTIVDCVYFPIPPLLWPILEKAQTFDTKNVFSEGLRSVQTKLEEKFYTSVSTFSADVAAVFSAVIGFTTITDVGDAENQLSGVAHSSLTPEQKEKKKLAKRIIKAIQQPLEEATRKEAELAGRPFEKELPNLEELLDQTLRRQAKAGLEITTTGEMDAAAKDEDELKHSALEPDLGDGQMIAETMKDNDTIHLAPTPDDNLANQNMDTHDDAADEAAIAAQLGQDTIQVAATHEPVDTVMGEDGESDPQASRNGAEPLTPPRSEKDLLAPLAYGGIPWYMEPFDPVGTTIHEERWTGREVLRDMSEELSELDDDELEDLADPSEFQLTDGGLPTADVSESVHKASRKQRKRWRGFK